MCGVEDTLKEAAQGVPQLRGGASCDCAGLGGVASGGISAGLRGGGLGSISAPPYGYRRMMIGQKPTLEINETEARFVRLMFQWHSE